MATEATTKGKKSVFVCQSSLCKKFLLLLSQQYELYSRRNSSWETESAATAAGGTGGVDTGVPPSEVFVVICRTTRGLNLNVSKVFR